MADDCWLRADVAEFFTRDPFDTAWAMDGRLVRSVAGRETLEVELGDRRFFLKRHRGVGWLEIVKNWLVLKRPVLGARNEFEACRRLAAAGLIAPMAAAFGERGPPASRLSFVLCDALLGFEDLEQLTNRWFAAPPDGCEKRALVMAVARFTRRFHSAGMVHRDFYLCHLLTHPSWPELGVLDLHRALIFDVPPPRWLERDLAALLYSALDLPLSRRAWLRFVRVYSGRPLRVEFQQRARFWRRVYRRALSLYAKGERKGLTRGNFKP